MVCRPDLGGEFSHSLVGRGLCGGPKIGKTITKFPKAAQPRFSPNPGPFGVRAGDRVGVRVRVRVSVRARE